MHSVKELLVSNEVVVALVEKAMKESPSAFNSQQVAVVLFGAESRSFSGTKLPYMVEKVTPAEAFEVTKGTQLCFAAGCRYHLVLRRPRRS